MDEALRALSKFKIEGAIESVALFGGGHINDTYRILGEHQDYLLQKINTKVFSNVDALEANLNGLFKTGSAILVEHIPTRSGQWLLIDDSGVWKTQVFNKDTYAPQVADNLTLVNQVAHGFGKFVSLTAPLDSSEFQEAISNFHNLNWRIDQFDEAVSLDMANRLSKSSDLISKANNFRWITNQWDMLIEEGLPLRVCHNDTKIDNILLSKTSNKFGYVIDLDTVGPGYVLYDFGDMMRTLLSPTKEGERDESKIRLRIDYFETLKNGFLDSCGDVLSPLELENLHFGGLYMTYMMGIRFLADYLNGDIYYKVSYSEENFIRARNQLKLLELMQVEFNATSL